MSSSVASTINRKSGRAPKAFAFCIGLPAALILLVLCLLTYNNRVPQMEIPTPKLPVPNGLDDFIQAGRLAGAMQHPSPLSLRGPAAQTLTFSNFAAMHKEAGPVLALMHQGLSKACMEPPVRSVKTDNFRSLTFIRDLARTNASEGYYQDLIGQPRRAADTYLDGMDMSLRLRNGGNIMTMIMAIACEAVSLSQFEPTMPRLSAAELAEIGAKMDRISVHKTQYGAILREEGYTSTAMELEMMRDPKSRSWQGFSEMASDMTGGSGPGGGLPTAEEGREAIAYMLADKSVMLRDNQRYIDALIKESEQPYTRKSRVPIPHNPVARMMADLLLAERQFFDANLAAETVLRVEVALYRYKKETGRFPDSLSSLVPRYLGDLPPDPFGGGATVPLRYRMMDGGQSFLLYSLGANMQDDGGNAGKNVQDVQGDIVAGKIWRSRRTAPGAKGK